jgi:glucose dehydrogenase
MTVTVGSVVMRTLYMILGRFGADGSGGGSWGFSSSGLILVGVALVDELVLFQREAAAERLAASVALKGLDLRVRLLVRLEIRDLAERASANVALVWLLTCMNSNVFL